MPRLTVVVPDRFISVDGEGLIDIEQDWSWVPSEVHAVQWDGTNGSVEFNNGQINESISDIGIWAQAIDKYNLEKTRLDEAETARLNAFDWTADLRTRRRERLFACDWVVTRATEAGTPVPAEWVTYRQALRDLPDTVPTSDHRAMCEDRNHASWPTIPS